MGQKVNPLIFRVGITRSWNASWYANKKQFGDYVIMDAKIKEFIRHALKKAGVSDIYIERSLGSTVVSIFSSKPGLLIGKKGDNIDKLKEALSHKFGGTFIIHIKEVHQPDLDSFLVGDSIAYQIEKRIPYRRAVKSAMEKVMQAGAKGVKVRVAGRLNGAEIARVEFFKEGNIPLHTLRADIDYAEIRAETTYGIIGIKVWIYKGLKFSVKEKVGDTLTQG